MMFNLSNKTKWFLKKIFLFTMNPYLAIKNKFDFDFLSAIKANKKLINENNSKYEPLSVDSVKKYKFDDENDRSYLSSKHLRNVINAEYFDDMQNYGYGKKIIENTDYHDLEYLKSFHLYPANVFVINEILDLMDKKLISEGLIIDYPSGIGNLFLYLSKFFNNNLFYGVDNFEQISKKDISTYQEKIGNIAEVNTIDYFYKNKKNENVEIVVSIELNLNLIIDDILKLDANYIIFETFYVSRFKSIKEKLSSKYKIYKINESIIVYKRIN